MEIARVVATRSSCLRRQVGAVLVKNRQILATGYNGVPARSALTARSAAACATRLGIPSGERHELCRGLHAEQNAIIQAAYHGVAISGAEIYCTLQPCVDVRQDAHQRRTSWPSTSAGTTPTRSPWRCSKRRARALSAWSEASGDACSDRIGYACSSCVFAAYAYWSIMHRRIS